MKRLKQQFRRDLRTKFIAIIVLVAIIAVGVTAVLSQRSFSRYTTEKLLHSERQNIALLSETLSQKLSSVFEQAYLLAVDPVFLDHLTDYKAMPRQNSTTKFKINSMLSNQFSTIPEIDAALVYTPFGMSAVYNKQSIYGASYHFTEQEKIALADFYTKVQKGGWAESLIITAEGQSPAVYVGCPVIGQHLPKEKVFSILMVKLNLELLCRDIEWNNATHLETFVVDQNDMVVLSADKEKIGKPVADLGNQTQNLTHDLDVLHWYLVKQIDKSAISDDITSYTQTTNLVYVVMILFVVFVVIHYMNQVLKLLRPLEDSFSRIETGQFQYRIPVVGENQISRISTHFNETMEKLEHLEASNKEHQEQLITTLRRQKEAELKTLESQINAHFVFNSLNMIYYQALEAKDKSAAKSIMHLSSILRYAFTREAQDVTLLDEITWVEQYLTLQKDRLGESFHYEVEMDDEIADWPMCKLLLQPFVENAVIHGLEETDQSNYILISAVCADETHIRIRICDNGVGMPLQMQECLRSVFRHETPTLKLGVGMSNAAERILKYYGQQATVDITCNHEETIFTLTLPYIGKKEKRENTNEII